MQRTKPPYRADHVGSILRSEAIKDARAKREKGEITAAQLKEIEDREIDKIVRKQEEVGLKLATDGEYRRSWWHLDFFWGLDGVEKITLPHGIKFHGVETRPEGYKITGKLDFLQPSDARPFPLSEIGHAGDAENVHPGAAGDAFPPAEGRHPEDRLSRASTTSSPTSARPMPRR